MHGLKGSPTVFAYTTKITFWIRIFILLVRFNDGTDRSKRWTMTRSFHFYPGAEEAKHHDLQAADLRLQSELRVFWVKKKSYYIHWIIGKRNNGTPLKNASKAAQKSAMRRSYPGGSRYQSANIGSLKVGQQKVVYRTHSNSCFQASQLQ